MSFKDLYIQTYWKYYQALERRLIRTEDYVAFDEVNSKTYSVEYLTLLQTICSEIDVVGKAIALYFDVGFDTKNANIKKWGRQVQKYLPAITTQSVAFKKGTMITPWASWKIEERVDKNNKPYLAYAERCGSPEWWNSYNAVRHARTTIDDGRFNYHRANQRNVIDSLAALYVMHRLMMAHLDENAYVLLEKSEIFKMPEWYDEYHMQFSIDSEGRPCIIYDDPDEQDE